MVTVQKLTRINDLKPKLQMCRVSESEGKQKVYELIPEILDTAISHEILPRNRYRDYKRYMEFFSEIINRKVKPGRAKTKTVTLYYMLAVSIGPRVTQDKLADIYSISPSSIGKIKKEFLKDSELSLYLKQLLREF